MDAPTSRDKHLRKGIDYFHVLAHPKIAKENMSTYSVRCRHKACRHRRVTKTHPDDYKVVPRCPMCGNRKGWRIENRAYNKRGLCHCSGPDMSATGSKQHFPHRVTHPLCDKHPRGFYNQAKAQGVADEDIPVEYGGLKVEHEPA